MYVCTAQDWTDNGWRGWKGVRLDKDRVGYVWGLCCSCQTEVSFLFLSERHHHADDLW
jgi:hypothetical protein